MSDVVVVKKMLRPATAPYKLANWVGPSSDEADGYRDRIIGDKAVNKLIKDWISFHNVGSLTEWPLNRGFKNSVGEVMILSYC